MDGLARWRAAEQKDTEDSDREDNDRDDNDVDGNNDDDSKDYQNGNDDGDRARCAALFSLL